MEYIIVGGSFDPFTRAHGAVIKATAEKYPNARIVIIPSVVSWHRKGKGELFSEDDRAFIVKEWVRTSLTDELRARISVDTHEYALQPNLRRNRGFIDTLRYFMESRSFITNDGPNTFRFVVGADEWKLFTKWKTYQQILELAKPIVVMRKGYVPIFDIPVDDVIELPEEFGYVSASKTREAILRREDRPCVTEGRKLAIWYLSESSFWESGEAKAETGKEEDETVLKTPIFDVQRIGSDIPGFRPVRVKSRDWVCVIVRQDDYFFGVRQVRWGTGKEYDEFVTGVVDEGEEPKVAAARELMEELGFIPPPEALHYIGSAPSNPGFMSNKMHYFFLDLDKTNVKYVGAKPDEHERLIPVKIRIEDVGAEYPALMLAGLQLLSQWDSAKK